MLYALPSYPQLSESYMHNELLAVQRVGVHVEVWAGRPPTAPSDEVSAPVHRGSIDAAIRKAAPDVIHVHWLVRNKAVREAARGAGVPVTVRAHSFDFSPEAVQELEADSGVRSIYLFPHQLAALGARPPKARALNPCYDPQRYGPSARKDPRRVARAGVARPEQGHDAFIRIASRLSGFHCVLIVASGFREKAYMDGLHQQNRDLGAPVEILSNLQYRDVAPVVAGAALYLHTWSPAKPYGMPVSIAEAMATGSYVLTPDAHGAGDYVGEAGTTYRSEEEAVEIIQRTSTWPPDVWSRMRDRACRRASENFSADRVTRALVADWQALRSERAGR